MERRKKTNRMLISISFLFFLSWAPINIFNILLDVANPFKEGDKDDIMIIIFAACHLSAMTSVFCEIICAKLTFIQSFRSVVIQLCTDS